jgi:hypothetical protein
MCLTDRVSVFLYSFGRISQTFWQEKKVHAIADVIKMKLSTKIFLQKPLKLSYARSYPLYPQELL